MTADMSEVDKLARDLGASAANALRDVRAVIQKGALNIKNDLRDQANAAGIPEAANLARSISYDTTLTPGGIKAEIGPTKAKKKSGRGGSFAFLYFGNSKNGPVLPDPGDALKREAGNVETYIDKALGESL